MATEKELVEMRERFEEVCEENQHIFSRKNEEYGNGIVSTGVLGAAIELFGAAMRLKTLVIQNPTAGADKIDLILNVAIDVHNYSNILILMMEDKNWRGE